MTQELGGSFSRDFGDSVTHLIAACVGSPKYYAAVNKLPVILPEWVIVCHEQQRLLPTTLYPVPPFLGLSVCVTGLSVEQRENVRKIVTDNGVRAFKLI